MLDAGREVAVVVGDQDAHRRVGIVSARGRARPDYTAVDALMPHRRARDLRHPRALVGVARRFSRCSAPCRSLAVVGRGLALGAGRHLVAPRATRCCRATWATRSRSSLMVGAGVAIGGTAAGWLVARRRFPGSGFLAWALLLPLAMPSYVMAYAYTDFLQYAGPVQTHAARLVRVVARRLLVSGRPLAAGCCGHVRVHAVSLRVPARAHGVRRAARRRSSRPRARSGLDRRRRVLARRAAARAPRDRGRHRAGADGDARRLRHRRVLRGRHVHDRHLPRMVLARRPNRGRAARHDAAACSWSARSRSSTRRAAQRGPTAARAARRRRVARSASPDRTFARGSRRSCARSRFASDS